VIADLAARYAASLDQTMRTVVDSAPDSRDFLTLLRYPLGWVNADGQPYAGGTGKRIRPLLVLLCAEAAGGRWQDALPAAAAVEILHNFSLVHDDIQDASPLRHNRPTVWTVWGAPSAINIGDALFALAYRALEGLSQTGLPPELTIAAWRILNHTNLELTRGQHLDMGFEHRMDVTVEEYLSMIEGKSAALLAASAQLGALAGSRSMETAGHFASFGLHLGIAFQIRDDILGIWGDPAVTGKSAATDLLSRKKSLPVLFALERSPALRRLYARKHFGKREVDAALELLDQTGARAEVEAREAAAFQQALSALAGSGVENAALQDLRRLAAALFGRSA
jgi:geranylgeranyl diphosphate synthase type I